MNDRDTFLQAMAQMGRPVTPVELEMCDLYAEELQRWQKKINLIGNSTANSIYTRHILDAAQLILSVPRGTILDVGSGAGIPGLIWSIFLDNPIYLCERIGKKTAFLNSLVRKLEVGEQCQVINDDVCNVNGPFNIITARAVTSVRDFLDLTSHLITSETLIILPKGKDSDIEIEAARKKWSFDTSTIDSLTDGSAKTIFFTHIHKL